MVNVDPMDPPPESELEADGAQERPACGLPSKLDKLA